MPDHLRRFSEGYKLLLAFTLLGSASIHAQTCTGVTQTPILRAESLDELVGDVVVTCSFGSIPPGTSLVFNILYSVNAQITSQPRPYWQANGTEIILILDDLATTPVYGGNFWQGQYIGAVSPSASLLGFNSIGVVAPPSGGVRTFRIKNVRINAAALVAAATLGSPFSEGVTVTASLNVYLYGGANLGGVSGPVGITAPTLNSSLKTAAGAPASAMTFQQAGGANSLLVGNPSGAVGAVNYNLTFAEAFPQAFKRRNVATTAASPNAIAYQNNPATIYNTETGFNASGLPNGLDTASLATQGTLLQANFTNVPPNVSLYVTVAPIGNYSGAASLVDPNSVNTVLAPVGQASVNSSLVGIYPVALSGGSGRAVWQVFAPDPTQMEAYTFGVVTAYTVPAVGAASVAGIPGPALPSTASFSTSSSPVPSFVDVSSQSLACQAASCLLIAPGAISLTSVAGATPTHISISVTSSGTPILFSFTPPDQAWATASVTSATTPATINLTIDPTILPAGLWTTNIFVYANGFLNVIPIQLNALTASDTLPYCNATNGAVTPTARAEGSAEKTGDLLILCTGGAPGTVLHTDVVVTLTSPVTSRILNPTTGATEVLMLVDEPNSLEPGPGPAAPITPGANLFQGYLTAPNTITFPNFTLTPAITDGVGMVGFGTTLETFARVLRIVNLRVNETSGVTPAPVSATLSFSAGLPISGSTVQVQYVQPALAFALNGSTLGNTRSLAFPPGGATYDLQFVENFAVAFVARSGFQTPGYAAVTQDVAGQVYASETDFYDSTLTTANGLNLAGLADSGTRLMARFSGIPAGVSLFVSTNSISAPASWSATLVSTDSSGAGAYSPVPATANTGFNGAITPVAPVTLSGGTGVAVWEITGSNPSALASLHFGLVAIYSTPQPAGGIVEASLAPLSSSHSADATSPIPRFTELTPPTLTATSGASQSARIGFGFSTPLSATLTDGSGNPLPGVGITFSPPASGATAALSSTTAITNSSGVVTVNASANLTQGAYTVTAGVGALAANFSLANSAAVAATITALSGTSQTTPPNTAFAAPLQVLVKDSSGNPAPFVTVAFTTPGSGASATLSAPSAVTNSAGLASINATANNIGGAYAVNASAGSATVSFSLTNAFANSLSTSLTLTPSTYSPVLNTQVTLTVVVQSIGSALTPTGAVTFTDNGVPFATAPVSGGIATASFTITAGGHAIVATYNGDSRFPPSSITIGLSPDKPTPTAILTASTPAAGTAQSVVLTVQVTGSMAGFPAPTGQVAFIDGAAFQAFATAPLVNGVATLSTGALPSGPHLITAVYTGDGVWSGVIAGTPVTVTVR